MHWYQKARLDWIEYGDKNTTFFHLSTVLKQWKNKIVAIRGPEGELLRDKELVKERIVDYFALLFTEDGVDEEFDIPTGIFPELPPREWNALNLPFTKPEIDEVVQNMGSLKAPGSDGFQPLFYQKNWELVKNNVYDLAFHVLEGKGLPPSLMKRTLSSCQKWIIQRLLRNSAELDCAMLPTKSSPRQLLTVSNLFYPTSSQTLKEVLFPVVKLRIIL